MQYDREMSCTRTGTMSDLKRRKLSDPPMRPPRRRTDLAIQ
jgi:hypothetical protein